MAVARSRLKCRHRRPEDSIAALHLRRRSKDRSEARVDGSDAERMTNGCAGALRTDLGAVSRLAKAVMPARVPVDAEQVCELTCRVLYAQRRAEEELELRFLQKVILARERIANRERAGVGGLVSVIDAQHQREPVTGSALSHLAVQRVRAVEHACHGAAVHAIAAGSLSAAAAFPAE